MRRSLIPLVLLSCGSFADVPHYYYAGVDIAPSTLDKEIRISYRINGEFSMNLYAQEHDRRSRAHTERQIATNDLSGDGYTYVPWPEIIYLNQRLCAKESYDSDVCVGEKQPYPLKVDNKTVAVIDARVRDNIKIYPVGVDSKSGHYLLVRPGPTEKGVLGATLYYVHEALEVTLKKMVWLPTSGFQK